MTTDKDEQLNGQPANENSQDEYRYSYSEFVEFLERCGLEIVIKISTKE